MAWVRASRRRRSEAAAWSGAVLEALEDRKLLSGGMVSPAGSLRGFAPYGMRGAEMSSFQEGRRGGFFGGGSLGLGGGMNNPSLLLTAPLLEGGTGQAAPLSPGVFAESAVQTALQTLRTELKKDMKDNSPASRAAIGTVQDDLDAIRNGTLSGTAAVTQVQTDAAAVLTSMGLTSGQVSQVQADQQAVASAIAGDPNRPAVTAGNAANLGTLQSVSAYLVGLPGISSFGMGGVSIRGFGPGGGRRGGFVVWR
jgi:hypothetical protein